MMLQRWVKACLVAGLVLACCSEAYGFGRKKSAGIESSCASPCAAPCASECGPITMAAAPAPQMMTVMVCEWVPQQYTATVTKYRTETQQQTYTAYKSEMVTENRTVTRNVCVP